MVRRRGESSAATVAFAKERLQSSALRTLGRPSEPTWCTAKAKQVGWCSAGPGSS